MRSKIKLKICDQKLINKQLAYGWMDGWVDESHFKDCSQ